MGYDLTSTQVIYPEDLNKAHQKTAELRVASGDTSILVIRRINQPDEPYYTLEYNDGRVVQCRGQYNCGMTEDVKAFVEKWSRRKLKKAQTKISA